MAVIDLPNEVKPGEVVRADDFNKMLLALRMSMIQPGVGYQRTINRSGTTLKIKDRRGLAPARINPAFSVIEVGEPSGNNYDVTLEPGRVCSANPVAAAADPAEDGYDYFVPEIDGTPMDQRDADGNYPKITVEDGFSIYCRIKRDATGVVVPPVKILAADRDEKSGHYQPPDPDDSGTEEVYQYRRIVDLDVVSGEVELKVWRRSDIDLEPFLWIGENVGSGADVFKEHAEDDGVYNFRRIKGCYGLDEEQDGDTVKLRFDAEHVGDAQSGVKANVYVEPDETEQADCSQKAQFRPLTTGQSGRDEIEVVQDADVVRIRGNGVNGSVRFEDCSSNEIVTLTFNDGLVTSAVTATIAVPGCPST